jgi:hypothetical protein
MMSGPESLRQARERHRFAKHHITVTSEAVLDESMANAQQAAAALSDLNASADKRRWLAAPLRRAKDYGRSEA